MIYCKMVLLSGDAAELTVPTSAWFTRVAILVFVKSHLDFRLRSLPMTNT